MSPWNGQLFPMSSLAFMALPIIFFCQVKSMMEKFNVTLSCQWAKTLNLECNKMNSPGSMKHIGLKAIPPNHGSQGLAMAMALSCPFQDLQYFRSRLPVDLFMSGPLTIGLSQSLHWAVVVIGFPWSFFWQQECSCLTQALALHCTPIYLVLGLQTWPKLSLFWLKD